MPYFYKEIFYIDLYEKEEKKKSIGFIKITIKDEKCNMQMQVKGMPQTDTLQCSIKEWNSKNEIGLFTLTNGQGNYERTCSRAEFEAMKGIYLAFSNQRYGKTIFREELEEKQENYEEPYEEQHEEDGKHEVFEKEIAKIQAMEENAILDEEIKEKTKEEARVATDKWQQLCNMFPVVHPFPSKEGEEYLTISPRDFVVLQSKHQGLVNNSFLLHGYYNYHHIILGKKIEENKTEYYIGVPGNYYTREKAVAVMFGFEGFEDGGKMIEGTDGTIPQGTFGYYMCRVEI